MQGVGEVIVVTDDNDWQTKEKNSNIQSINFVHPLANKREEENLEVKNRHT